MTASQDQQLPAELPTTAPNQRKLGRGGLVAAAAAGVLLLMAATGAGVWYLTRPATATPAAAPAPASSAPVETLTASGTVVLQRGEFTWTSVADPTCAGWKGLEDLRPGAQVSVTDAGGKVLAFGTLDRGTAGGITTESDGTHRAATCTLPFSVPGVPRGAGPYGVEVAHRGVVRYDEGHLGIIQVGL